MNLKETHYLMTYIFAEYDAVVTDAKRDVWYDQFKNIPYETVMAAARLLISKKSFGIPKAYQLRDALEELSQKGCSDEEAWDAVIKSVQQFGRYQKEMAISHLEKNYGPVVSEVANKMFEEIGISTIDKLPTLRAQFWKILAAARSRTIDETLGLKPKLTALNPPERFNGNFPEGVTAKDVHEAIAVNSDLEKANPQSIIDSLSIKPSEDQ